MTLQPLRPGDFVEQIRLRVDVDRKAGAIVCRRCKLSITGEFIVLGDINQNLLEYEHPTVSDCDGEVVA